MTDTFDVTEDLSSSSSLDLQAADIALDAAPPEPALPNGFVLLGLAPELVQAVEDLGFTQPTAVQERAIPLALPEMGDDQASNAGKQRFIDLMVSSQTGSGKTAAFLLPVLHTLLTQQQQAAAEERLAFERAAQEAAAKGEAPPKRPKRKDPTNARPVSYTHLTLPTKA